MTNLFERLKPQQVKASERQNGHDPIADKILRTLRQRRPDGLNREAIFGLFDRNKNVTLLNAALDKLWQEGKVRYEQQQQAPTPRGGRPPQVWFATAYD